MGSVCANCRAMDFTFNISDASYFLAKICLQNQHTAIATYTYSHYLQLHIFLNIQVVAIRIQYSYAEKKRASEEIRDIMQEALLRNFSV